MTGIWSLLMGLLVIGGAPVLAQEELAKPPRVSLDVGFTAGYGISPTAEVPWDILLESFVATSSVTARLASNVTVRAELPVALAANADARGNLDVRNKSAKSRRIGKGKGAPSLEDYLARGDLTADAEWTLRSLSGGDWGASLSAGRNFGGSKHDSVGLDVETTRYGGTYQRVLGSRHLLTIGGKREDRPGDSALTYLSVSRSRLGILETAGQQAAVDRVDTVGVGYVVYSGARFSHEENSAQLVWRHMRLNPQTGDPKSGATISVGGLTGGDVTFGLSWDTYFRVGRW